MPQKKISYAEAFRAHFPEARENLKAQINKLTKNPTPFIWDQINLKREERIKIYNRLNPTHRVVYVCFRVPVEECIQRHHARERNSGSIVNEEYIHELTDIACFPQQEDEPFYKVLMLTHPDWKQESD